MAEIDNVLAELRDRIMRPFESVSPKPATQEVDSPVKHSAAVALRRLVHPGRDGGVVVEDDPVSAPVNPERGDGVVVGGDPISPLIRRLALDMPELMEEVVAFIERRIAELNERDDGAAPRPTESAPAALVRATPTLQDDDTGTATISLRFDTQVLARIDTGCGEPTPARRTRSPCRAALRAAMHRLAEPLINLTAQRHLRHKIGLSGPSRR